MIERLCDVCGNKEFTLIEQPYQKTQLNKIIYLDLVEMYKCNFCGKTFFTPEQYKNFIFQFHVCMRDVFGLVSPKMIMDIRERNSLSEKELGNLLNVSEECVRLLENDWYIPTIHVNIILLLIDQNPDIINILSNFHFDRERKELYPCEINLEF